SGSVLHWPTTRAGSLDSLDDDLGDGVSPVPCTRGQIADAVNGFMDMDEPFGAVPARVEALALAYPLRPWNVGTQLVVQLPAGIVGGRRQPEDLRARSHVLPVDRKEAVVGRNQHCSDANGVEAAARGHRESDGLSGR